ncbi:MAG: aminoacyl-tRNA hydrolase [bacterium]|nr:aminoacyl-tRNA hydrolase [bacterium]
MKLIVGLGNPGEKHLHNRHNLGFSVLEHLARKIEAGSVKWGENKKFKAEILKTKLKEEEVILVKPLTFMNNSGWPVKKIVDWYHIEPAEIWVVHDDLDLKPGQIKIRYGGGTAGHHGLESIIEHLGTSDFVRFRLGIGKPLKSVKGEERRAKKAKGDHQEIERYVLESFTGKERVEAEKMIKKAVEALELAFKKDIESAMNKFNLK